MGANLRAGSSIFGARPCFPISKIRTLSVQLLCANLRDSSSGERRILKMSSMRANLRDASSMSTNLRDGSSFVES